MEKRKPLKDNLKIAIAIIILIAIFAGGYLFAWYFLCKPLDENQFASCENIAQNAYEQKGKVLIEAPEEFYVTMTTTTITVKLADKTYRGAVVARLQNGELVMTRDIETPIAIATSIMVGILFTCVGALAIGLGNVIIEKTR